MTTVNQAQGLSFFNVGTARSRARSVRQKSRRSAGRLLAACLLGMALLTAVTLACAQPAGTDSAAYDQAIAAARVALDQRDYDIALQHANEALKARPDDAAAKALQAQAEAGRTRQDAVHKRAMDSARQAMQAGNYDRAAELLKLVVDGWPDDAEAKQLLQQAQQAKGAKGDYDQAIKDASAALDAGDYDKAIASAKVALAARPGDRQASDLLLRANMRQRGAQVPPAAAAAAVAAPPPEAAVPVPGTNAPAPEVATVKAKSHNFEVAASGDFFYGQGNVTFPIGFALATKSVFSSITPFVAKPDRNSDYFGGTVSFGYKGAIFLDLAYSHGNSSGDTTENFAPISVPGGSSILNSTFSIRDDWYQAYIKYTFPGLRFTPVRAYLRAGGSFVKAQLEGTTSAPGLGLYSQHDDTSDYLGNLGAGVGYFYPLKRWVLGVQVEAEAFYGSRTQDSQEDLPFAELTSKPSTTIDNTLYGGIGRATARVQYSFGESRLLKAFVEGGFQGKFTEIEYSSQGNFKGGTFDELLYGPYVKLGLRYSF